jgi:carboxymethylenebutenolidase
MKKVKTGLVLPLAVVLVAVGCGGSGDEEYAGRMAAEHAGDRPVASGAAEAQPAVQVVEKTVVYATIGSQPVEGFLARPADGPESAPGLIVIQEWWGLNENIRAMARRLAGEGYTALAVDLYGGEVAEDPQQARELMTAAMQNEAELEENLRQAVDYLRANLGASEVGTIGWCFGGGWSLRAALLMPEKIDATVIYYGRVTPDKERLIVLRTPILGIFGAEDSGIPLEGVRAFEQALDELGKEAEIHVYEGAQHAFANPSGTRYDAEAAEQAWSETLAFLKRHLR